MRSSVRLVSPALLFALLGLPASGRAQFVPLASQFQVNSYTTSAQVGPAVAALGNGGFVAVWQSSESTGGDTSSGSIQGQRFDAAGNPLGSQFQVNTYTTTSQFLPKVATDAAGNFVVVWNSYGSAGTDTDYMSVQARRFDAAGVPQGPDFQVNTYTTDSQRFPAVAADAAGNFVVVWHSVYSDGPDPFFSIQAQRYDSAGVAQGGEFQVNSYTSNYSYNVAVAADPMGNFVVIWSNYPGDGLDTPGGSTLKGQRYDSAGVAQGSEFQVNSYSTGRQVYPAVAADTAGNFVVVWQNDFFAGSPGSDTGDPSIQARRFDAAGVPQGPDFQVNSYPTGTQKDPDVAVDGVGNFVVAWESPGSAGSDTSGNSVQAQRYDAAGVAQGGELQVNSYTSAFQGGPAAAADALGHFVIAWTSSGSVANDQSSTSVQAQRYAIARTILGKKILVKDPNGTEARRGVIALGRETATDVGAAIIGDPTVNGATLRVITNGTTDADQTYLLGVAGWSAAGTAGFKYTGPTDLDGDPVKKVILKRTPGGTALLKALVKGNVGTQSMDVVPPNLGSDGGIILTINGGGTYCAAFGGGAGGIETADTTQLWKVVNATAEGCPTP